MSCVNILSICVIPYYYIFLVIPVNYFIEKSNYPLKYGDLIITNTTEIHAPVFHSDATYERIIFHFSPEIIKYLSFSEYSLKRCFIDRSNGKLNKVSLNEQQISEFIDLYKKIVFLNTDLNNGNIILKLSKLLELLVLIDNAFSNNEPNLASQYSANIPDQLIDIINYIDHNLMNDISLDNLGKIFFINKTYLCTLFKKHIGKTVHQYIIYRRISYAKQLLASGYNVTETCLLCGFNDYSNFIKTFKNITGKPPGSFKKASSRMK